MLFTDYFGTRLILILTLVNISRFLKDGDNNALLGCVKVLEGVPGCSGFFILFQVFRDVPVFRELLHALYFSQYFKKGTHVDKKVICSIQVLSTERNNCFPANSLCCK